MCLGEGTESVLSKKNFFEKMTDASFSIEFKIPASLARSIREDNARRLAEMQMMENNNKNNTHSNDEYGCEKDEEDWEDQARPELVLSEEEDNFNEDDDFNEEDQEEKDDARHVLLLVNPTLVVGGEEEGDGVIDEDAIVRRVDELCSNDFSALETLLGDASNTGACLYTTSDRVGRDLERLESRFPVGKWYVLNQYPSRLDSMMYEHILGVKRDEEAHSLQFLRSCLRNCLRDVRWKCMMMKELQILSVTPPKDDQYDDKLPMPVDGNVADDEDEEPHAELSILDQILAMILDRMPPLHYNETNENRYLRLGKLHEKIKSMWIDDYGALPVR